MGNIILFEDDFPVDLKELKRLADLVDDNGRRELIYFLQSGTNGVTVREIDEIQEQKHKMGLFAPVAKKHSVVRFGKYTVKTRTREVKRYRCKFSRQIVI